MNYLKQLLEKWTCKHKWETRTHATCKYEGTKYLIKSPTTVCTKCGKIKKIIL